MSSPRIREILSWPFAALVLAVEGGSYLLAVAAAAVAEQFTSLPELAVLVFVFITVLAATTPLRRRLLTPIREWARDPPNDTSVRGPIAHVRERRPGWWRREASLLGIGVLAWVGLVGVTGAVLTGWQYRRYANGATDAMHPANTMALLVLCTVAAGVLAAAVGTVAGRESGPVAIVASVRAAPWAFLRNAFAGSVRAVVSGFVGLLAANQLEGVLERASTTLVYDTSRAAARYVDPLTVLLWITIPVVVAAAARVTSFVGTEPSTAKPAQPRIDRHNVRVVAVVLLLVAAPIVATAAVRIDDTGYSGGEVEPLPDGSSATLETAQANTLDRSYRRVTTIENRNGVFRSVRASDRADRQYRQARPGSDRTVVSFDGEGVAAVDGLQHSGPSGLLEWTAGNWSVDASRSGAFGTEGHRPSHPDRDAPWRTVRGNDTSLVLGVDGAAVGEASEMVPQDGDHYEVAENATARVVIDRERGVLESATVDAVYYRIGEGNRTDRRDVNVVRRYENVGTHDVQRPDALGPRQPVEWLWDFLYY